ncbi:MAG TPA: alpha/beta fold hydrolase [Gemmatimonadota bacterium]|nr:alpha/beta fold hydrolase [Gemmatimonadota bacterium]
MRDLLAPRVFWIALALVTACGGGADRGPAQVQAEAETEGWHRARTGRAAVPLSRPVGVAATPAARGFLGRAYGASRDTTGVLLPRAFDPAVADRYYLYLPRGIEARREWPLILYLHGRSLRGDDLALLTRYGLPARLEDERDFPFVVVAPQLPGDQSWTDTDGLARLVRTVAGRYPVDRDRVYVIGYSMGGGGVWRVAADHPELFAAAAPAAAWTPQPTDAVARALRDVPIRIYHGTADEAAPFSRAEVMAGALEAAGVDVTLTVYPGARHPDLARIYQDDELYAWLLRHRRSAPAR